MSSNGEFICCQKCGKRLVKKLPNGAFQFVFGKVDPGKEGGVGPPVQIYIHGAFRIKCLRRSCGLWNTLTPFSGAYIE